MNIDVDGKITVIKHDEAVDKFCTMAEIVSSCEINEKAAKIILNALPTDFLEIFISGLELLRLWTAQIIVKRRDNGH